MEVHRYGKYVSEAEYNELKAENARLKAEVERMTAKQTDIDRVQAQSDFYRSKLMNETAYSANVQLLDQVKHLEAQVERLTKAGDAMIDEWWLQLSCPERMKASWMQEQAIVDWNAAKKGGQP